MKSETFSELPLNTSSLATSVFDPILGLDATSPPALPSTSATSSVWICTCIAISYFYCC